MSTTIFVTNYNYAAYLGEAIESALDQDDPEGCRVVVVDDGSTDGSLAVCGKYGSDIEVIEKPNTGLSDSRNVAASACTTPYLLFLDADNRLPPDFVRTCREALESTEDSFAYTQLRYFGDRQGRSDFSTFDVNRLKRGNYIHSGALFRCRLFEKYAYDTRLRHGLEDWDFYLSLVRDGRTGLLVEATDLHFRVHGRSMGDRVQRRRSRRVLTYLRILVKHRRFLGPMELAAFARRSTAYRLRRRTAGERRASLFIVAKAWRPQLGGVEKQMFELADAALRAGLLVDVWTRAKNAEVPPGASLHTPPSIAMRGLAHALWLCSTLVRVRVGRSRVVVLGARVGPDSALAAGLGRALRAPTVVYVTGGDEGGTELARYTRPFLRRTLIGWSVSLIAHTAEVERDARRIGYAMPVHVLPLMVPAQGAACAWDMDEQGGRWIAWCGRDDPVKNLPMLVAVYEELHMADPSWRCLAISDRPLTALPAGFVNHVGCADPRSHYTSDVVAFVMPSHYEGLSNALVEAMLEGVPAVAFDVGGNKEWIERLDAGVVLDRGSSASEVARAVATLEASSGLRERALGCFGEPAANSWLTVLLDPVRGRRRSSFTGRSDR